MESKMEFTTKEKLVITASNIFSEFGFAGATTRMITKELGMSLSTIPFYFGTKENLYKAVLERAANFTIEYLKPVPEEVLKASELGKLTKNDAEKFLKSLVEKQVEWSLGKGPDDIVKLIIKEHTTPTECGQIIYDVLFKQVIETFATLIIAITGIDDPEWATIYSCSINGEILFFCEHKQFIEKALGDKRFNGPVGKRIKDIITNKVLKTVYYAKEFYDKQ